MDLNGFLTNQNIFVVLLLLAVILAIFLFVHLRNKKANRRFAIRELNAIRERYAQNLDNKRFIYEINLLIRRLSVTNFSRKQVENLTGEDWLQFLDATGNTYEFTQGAGKVLAHGSYTFKEGELDTGALYKIVKKWIKIQT